MLLGTVAEDVAFFFASSTSSCALFPATGGWSLAEIETSVTFLALLPFFGCTKRNLNGLQWEAGVGVSEKNTAIVSSQFSWIMNRKCGGVSVDLSTVRAVVV